MMGPRQVEQGALFYEFSLEGHVPADHLLRSIDRFVDLSRVRRELAPFYSSTGAAFGRSGADDPDADRRLLLRHPLGAAPLRGGPSEPGLSLVLPARARGPGARPLDLLQEPARPLPRERSAAARVRDSRAPLHGGRPGRRRGLRRRRQPDQGRCQPAARHRGRPMGLPPEQSSRAIEEYLAVLDDAAFGAATDGHAEVHLAGRSGGALDRCPWRPRLLRLLGQLPDRPRQRDHRRCRGDDRHPPGRGDGGQAHDRSHDGALRSLPGAARRRQRPMARPRCSAGSSTSRGSSRT